jgi:NitT/TauT family transport system substrate-binding protein
MRILTLAAVVLASISLGGSIATAQPEPPLRIAASATDSFAEAIYAEEAGFFKAAGLRTQLVLLANSGAIAAAVAGGSVDVGLANPIAIAAARSEGLPFYVIAPSALFSASEPATLLVVAKNSPLQQPKDLEGKTIGLIEVRGITEASVRAWLANNGADANKVRYIEMSFGTMTPALTQGRIDAAFIAEPALTAARPLTREFGSPYAAFADAWFINVWFATKDWLAKNPAVAHRFVQAIERTAAWANTHRAESGTMLEKYSPLAEDVVAKMTRTRFAEKLDPALMQPVLESALKYGVLKNATSAKDLVMPGY